MHRENRSKRCIGRIAMKSPNHETAAGACHKTSDRTGRLNVAPAFAVTLVSHPQKATRVALKADNIQGDADC